MKSRMVVVLAAVVSMVAFGAPECPADTAEQMLVRWCDGLMALQVKECARPELQGGVLCPACGFLHGRICDVVYPFTHLYVTTGARKYLTAAEAALDWCERNMLLPDGLYRNDRQSYWRSTTAFFAISLWKTLDAYGAKLPPETRANWRRIFLRSAASAYNLYETDFKPVVNYYCVYPELMYLAGRETNDAKYFAAARRMAEHIRTTYFDDEGFLIGEGRVNGALEGRTKRGCAMVDLGYNLEESLAALIEYANLAGDTALRAKAVASAKVQLAFVLPDGAIDNSCGSRSVKWTYYGSRTSDGILTLLTLLRNDVPYAAEMSRRVLALYTRCTGTDGLIAGGLQYAEAGEPACVHHTFARAKTLVDYIRSGLAADMSHVALPREARDVARHYKTLDAYLVSVGSWRATFSANDAFNIRREAAVSGGTLSLLWHEHLGPLAVGTLGSFFYAEAHNMQDDRHDMTMRCLAPRIVAGKHANIFDCETDAHGALKDGVFLYRAAGRLTDPNGHKTAPYVLTYALRDGTLKIDAQTGDATAQFRFPLVAGPHDVVTLDGCRATILRGAWCVELTSSAPLALEKTDRNGRIWSPVAGCLCAPFSVSLAQPVSLTLTCRKAERE